MEEIKIPLHTFHKNEDEETKYYSKYDEQFTILNNLYNCFGVLNDKNYFVTSYIKENCCKIYLRLNDNGQDTTLYTFETSSIDKNYFKKLKKHNPLRIEKIEEDDCFIFNLIIKKQPLPQKLREITISLNPCDICFENSKSYFKELPFNCKHSTFCIDCLNSMIINKHKTGCPLCRKAFKKGRGNVYHLQN